MANLIGMSHYDLEELKGMKDEVLEIANSENPPANWADFLARAVSKNTLDDDPEELFVTATARTLLRILGGPVTAESFDELIECMNDFMAIMGEPDESNEDCEDDN